ncbi:MAG: FimB/Mfa2 family fimbrial subunit [Alistipes sp.]|nr:FimB/Mfa2 family fimbrial subunit [Alistipes sp.]
MKYLYTAAKLSILALCIQGALCSCVRDDRDDCPDEEPKVRIVVKTLAEVTRADTDYYNIENVLIYIFDEQKRFVGTWSGGAYTFGEAYVATLDLDPGTYHFVVWTNQGEIYSGATQTQADDLVVALQYNSGGIVAEEIPDLHHGMLADAQVLPQTDNTFQIIIRPNTYRVNFTVEGVDPTDRYSFSVKDNNTHYMFDNTIVDNMDEIVYLRTAGFTGGELTASIKTLRLADDRSPLFELQAVSAGASLHTGDLVDMIITAYAGIGHTVDFDTEFEFDLTLSFDTQLGLTITVTGWNYVTDPTPIG